MRLAWATVFPPILISDCEERELRSNPVVSIAAPDGFIALENDGASGRGCVARLHPARIVRAFPGDGHVVDMALAQTRAGDADELRLLVKLREIPGADITHCRAQATGELMHDIADRALVGHLPFDALGHELQRVLDVLLEITVGRATRHGADRTHAAISL